MPIPSTIDDLSTTAGSNSPLGSEPPTEGDNHIRALAAILKQTYEDQADRNPDWVSVEGPTYGAVGDGVTDDTAAIQDAIDAAGSGVVQFGKNKTYKITSALTISNSDLTIYGNGSTLDGSDIAASASLDDVYALKIEGSIGSDIPITVSAAEGDVELTVDSTTGLAADNIIFAYSDEIWPEGATAGTSFKGALHRIRSVDSGTVLTTMDGMFFSLDSSTANIKKVTTVRNVAVHNLKVLMGGIDKAHAGILLNYTDNCKLIDCETTLTEDAGVRVYYSFGGLISGGSFTYCNSPADGSSGVTGNTGYGVVPGVATRDFIVEGAHFRGCRHAIAGGGEYPAIACVIRNNTVDGGRSADYDPTYQLDCHEDCTYWVFDSNHISGSSDTTGTGGIQIRGQHTRVVNNTITNAQQDAIAFENFDTSGGTSYSAGCTITGNVIRAPRLSGIKCTGSTAAQLQDVVINNNIIAEAGDDGIILSGVVHATINANTIRPAAAGNRSGIRLVGTAASAGNRCRYVTITNNIIDTPTLHGVRGDYADSVTIAGNVVTSATGEGVNLTNCTEIVISNNKLATSGNSRHGVTLAACASVSVTGNVAENAGTASGSSSGVVITGASTDVSVVGGVYAAFINGVLSVSPADYVTVVGVNARNCTNSVDVSASANTATAGNL